MKNIIKMLFVIFIFNIFVFSVQAQVFSDNFNDGNIDDWTITGAWNIPTNGGWDNNRYLNALVNNNPSATHYYNALGYSRYATFYIKATYDSSIYVFSDGTNNVGVRAYYSGGAYYFQAVGFSGTTTTVSVLTSWYKIELYQNSSTSTHWKIKRISDSVVILDEIAATTTQVVYADRIKIINTNNIASSYTASFDDIFIDNIMYSVSGVVNETNNNSVGGATISYSGGSTITNSNGVYTFTNVQAGTYDFTASKAGFASQTKSIAVTSNLINQNFTLFNFSTPQGGYINFSNGSSYPSIQDITYIQKDKGFSIVTTLNNYLSSNYQYYVEFTDFNGNVIYIYQIDSTPYWYFMYANYPQGTYTVKLYSIPLSGGNVQILDSKNIYITETMGNVYGSGNINFSKSQYNLYENISINYNLYGADFINYHYLVKFYQNNNYQYGFNLKNNSGSLSVPSTMYSQNIYSDLYATLEAIDNNANSNFLSSTNSKYGYNYSLIASGNISTDKTTYNLTEKVKIYYNITANGRIRISSNNMIFKTPVVAGINQEYDYYLPSTGDIGSYFIGLLWTDDGINYYLINDIQINVNGIGGNSVVQFYNHQGFQGESIFFNAYLNDVDENNGYLTLVDSQNNIKLNKTVIKNQLNNYDYYVQYNDPTSGWSVNLYNSSGILVSQDFIQINAGIITPTTTIIIQTPQPQYVSKIKCYDDGTFLSSSDCISQNLFGKITDDNGNIGDVQIKTFGNKIAQTLILFVAILFVIGLYTTYKKWSK